MYAHNLRRDLYLAIVVCNNVTAKGCPHSSISVNGRLWFRDYESRVGWSMIKPYLKPYLNSVLGHKLILILSLHGAGFFISNLHIKCNCHYFSLNIILRDYKSHIIKKYANYSNYIQIKWWLIRDDTDSVVKSSYSVLKCLNITL